MKCGPTLSGEVGERMEVAKSDVITVSMICLISPGGCDGEQKP
jgi:hypothetical protein